MSDDGSEDKRLKFKISAILVMVGFLLFTGSFFIAQDTTLKSSNATVEEVENMNDGSAVDPMRGNSSVGLKYSELSEEQQADLDKARSGEIVENPRMNFPIGTFIVTYEDRPPETFTTSVAGNLLPAIILVSLGLMVGGTVSMFRYRPIEEREDENPEEGEVVRSHMEDTKWNYVVVGYDDDEKAE